MTPPIGGVRFYDPPYRRGGDSMTPPPPHDRAGRQ